jgi:hypothetical protein
LGPGKTVISKGREKSIAKHSLILVILLYIPLFSMAPSKVDVIWSDDFDDGEYDGWFVANGTFSAEDYTLKPVLGDNTYMINHLSTATSGTWSFDVLVGEGAVIWLMYDGVGYGLIVAAWFGMDGAHLRLYNVSYEKGNVIGERIFQSGIPSWQHIDVTRNLDGRTCVYLNGTLFIDVVDYVARKSWFFMYNPYGESAIDNIVVSNTVDIEPPPPPLYKQTWFLATAGVVAVAVITILVFLGRRKH